MCLCSFRYVSLFFPLSLMADTSKPRCSIYSSALFDNGICDIRKASNAQGPYCLPASQDPVAEYGVLGNCIKMVTLATNLDDRMILFGVGGPRSGEPPLPLLVHPSKYAIRLGIGGLFRPSMVVMLTQNATAGILPR